MIAHRRPYCYAKLAKACKPRERLTVSVWADRHRWLSSKQSGERGRWRTDRNPILREIMDAMSAHSNVREITIMKSSQVGVTEAVVNKIGYNIEHAPAPTMLILPTLENRDTWKVQKLNPLLQESGAVRDILGGLKSRDAANSKDAIDFPGGILFLGGGNSPNSYAQKSARDVIMDDLDRFPSEVGEEGDPVSLGRGRAKSFPRYKLVKISTPTIKGSSLIEREFEEGDQRRYHVACPACGALQPLKWENLKWDQVQKPPRSAWYECAECGSRIEEHHKPRLLAEGRWIPAHPDRRRRSYHISALYAPIGLGPSWLDLANTFLLAQGDPAKLKTFVNTDLGETWEDQSTRLKTHDLAKRMEDVDMGVIPPGVLAITISVDTQDTWLDCSVWGWTATGHRLIDWHQIKGNTTFMPTWDELEEFLHQPRVNAWGKTIRPAAVGIDSRGHRAKEVRDFVQRQSLRVRVFATQGSTSRMGRPIALTPSHPDKTLRGKTIRGGYGVWNIGTEFIKDYLYGRLVSDGELPPESRAIRFPSGLPTEYFDGLLSEVYNPETKRYEQKKGAKYKRNEPLDGFVIAYAVGNHKEVMLGRYRNGQPDPNYWTRLAAILEAGEPGQENQKNEGQQEKPTQEPTRHARRRVVNTGGRR